VRPVTIEDVAAASGVSPTTVSHVFSGHRPVSSGTRQHVEDVARRLGYRPSAVARSLRSRRTDTILIVVPDITNTFYPELVRGVQDTVAPAGYYAMVGNTDAVERYELALLELAMSRRVDGLVFHGFRVAAAELTGVADAGVAVVNLGEGLAGAAFDSVRSDDRVAAAEATGFLLERYGRSIAMIDGDELAPVGRNRRLGFELACRGAGVREPRVVVTGFTRVGGRRGMDGLLHGGDRPRAVLCANDMIALGAIDVLKVAGLRVPEDVAVVGHDDVDAATIVSPQLTTTRIDARRIGALAGELLTSRMTGAYGGVARDHVIAHKFIVRESA
jgi:LacI family transcriptional regulator, galactose operon repressor